MIDLSVVIVSWNTRSLVLDCIAAATQALAACRSSTGLSGEIVLVDNGSEDGTRRAVRAGHPSVQLVALERNRGFAVGANAGIERSVGRVILLLNSDATLERVAIERCLGVLAERPEVGVVGPQLVHTDGRLQNSVHVFPSLFTELIPTWLPELILPGRFPSKRRPPREPTPVDAVLGASLFVRRESIEAVGKLSEDYFFFLEETDLCWRIRSAGWQVLYVPDAQVVHVSGASSKQRDRADTRIEYNRSLDHFLKTHRGAHSARAVRIVRLLKNAASVLLLGALAPLSARLRVRLHERWRVLVWQLSGRPPDRGLAAL